MISLGIDNLQFTLDLLSAEICLLPLLPHIILFLYENSVHSKRHFTIRKTTRPPFQNEAFLF